MDDKIKVSYEALVPKDQIVIDAMILTLFEKDRRYSRMVEDIMHAHAQEKEKNDEA